MQFKAVVDVKARSAAACAVVGVYERGDLGEAARLIESSMEKTLPQKFVTYDFERQMQGATKAKTSEFATRMIENMG